MPEQSAAYEWFWQKMNALTESRSMSKADMDRYHSEKAKQRFERFKRILIR